ncbi:MAG: hypothetical protein AAGI54_06195 [Planctomycetota bacterium]
MKCIMTAACCAMILPSVGATPLYYSSQEAFLSAVTPTDFDSFEDLIDQGALIDEDVQIFNRDAFDLRVSADISGGFDIQSKSSSTAFVQGFNIDGDRRISYEAVGSRGGFVFDFTTAVTAFGLIVSDAPEVPDGTGNFDLTFTDSNGDSVIVATGPVANASGLFFGIENVQAPFTSGSFSIPGLDGVGIDAIYTRAIPEPGVALVFIATAMLTFRPGRRDDAGME